MIRVLLIFEYFLGNVHYKLQDVFIFYIFEILEDLGLDLEGLEARGKRKKFREEVGCDEDQCLKPDACDVNATCQNKCKG